MRRFISKIVTGCGRVWRTVAPIVERMRASPVIHRAARVGLPILALAMLVIAMGGTWSFPRAGASPLELLERESPHGVGWSARRSPAARPAAVAGPVAVVGPGAVAAPGSRPRGRRLTGVLVGKANLNTATAEELERLPAIGPSKAALIIEWRQRNGGYRRIADIRHVRGIGYKTFKRLAPFLDITGPTTLAIAAAPPSAATSAPAQAPPLAP